jgi:peptidoglycan hydrolase-like protein with peptidoglycan-binding domain
VIEQITLAEHVAPDGTPIRRTTTGATTGLGAWSFGYYYHGMNATDPRQIAAIHAFKQALIDNGFGQGIDLNVQAFGTDTDRNTRAFQAARGLQVDGVIGMITARYLFHHYTYASEAKYSIPNKLVTRLGNQESANDPTAQGYFDPGDEGWGQIHLAAHPGITQQQAWTPSFAIEFTAQGLQGFYASQIADWDGAVASWNCGQYYAKQWVQAGKPAYGGPILAGQDMWTRATHYVTGVKSQPG